MCLLFEPQSFQPSGKHLAMNWMTEGRFAEFDDDTVGFRCSCCCAIVNCNGKKIRIVDDATIVDININNAIAFLLSYILNAILVSCFMNIFA